MIVRPVERDQDRGCRSEVTGEESLSSTHSWEGLSAEQETEDDTSAEERELADGMVDDEALKFVLLDSGAFEIEHF